MRAGVLVVSVGVAVVTPVAADPDAGTASVVLASGARDVVLDRDQIVIQRDGGRGAVVLMQHVTVTLEDQFSATVGAFLGHADLLDVTVRETSRHGWQGGTHELHYIIDTSGSSDATVCTFDGYGEHGGEWSSTETTIAVAKTHEKPLAFDVTRTEVTRTVAPEKTSKTSKQVDHYKLHDASCGTP